ncbi:putative phytoene dehydrogenase [Sorangium cellulosum So ce56]|uniref:Phytoene dehydrogenase n=1 Tax=Sorangium cellulosum (strain So ce56) TaxID=448385 RepID=A9GN00_SORC5|nr:NAD(P)/FAD-dependent oxidoreductase [Sorangium cellulosum]CAN93509.1 putative phytoene dehydrogenase [Sorangium cellulosum So ce56]
MEAEAAGDRRFDVIVVGSGIGGLTAALHVAVRGRSVLVLEAAKEIGGLLAPFRRGAYRFDTGLHYLGECGPGQAFARILEALGLADAIHFHELCPDGFDRIVFPGYEIAMPKGAERYHARLAADFPRERRGLDAFFDHLRAFREASAGWTEIRRGAPYPRFFAEHARTTYGDLIDGLIGDPLLRAVLAAQGGNYALPPGKASALVGLGILDHYLGGAYFPRGGSGALRDALVRAIAKRGGLVRKGRAVTRILTRRGRVEGVRCEDGEAIFAPAVISNADAAVTYLELMDAESVPARTRNKAEHTRPSLGSLTLFLGTSLDLATAGMTDANVWHLSSHAIDRAYAPLFAGELPSEDSFFLSSPSLKDPSSGPHTLVLSTIVPYEPFSRWSGLRSMRRGPEYEDLKRRLLDRYLGGIERYVPAIRDHLDVIEVATPLTHVTYTGSPRGGMYGPEHTPDQVGPFRHRIEGTIPGLYLCGASTLGAGVVVSAVSGFLAGALATGAKGA